MLAYASTAPSSVSSIRISGKSGPEGLKGSNDATNVLTSASDLDEVLQGSVTVADLFLLEKRLNVLEEFDRGHPSLSKFLSQDNSLHALFLMLQLKATTTTAISTGSATEISSQLEDSVHQISCFCRHDTALPEPKLLHLASCACRIFTSPDNGIVRERLVTSREFKLLEQLLSNLTVAAKRRSEPDASLFIAVEGTCCVLSFILQHHHKEAFVYIRNQNWLLPALIRLIGMLTLGAACSL